MDVILICGKAEAGKTLTANVLLKEIKAIGKKGVIIPYGDYVKSTARLIWGWNGEKDELGRGLLQWWGTDCIRKNHPDFWIETVRRLATVIESSFDFLIIDDCRFVNEIEAWTHYPHVSIRVERPLHENRLTLTQQNHPSEKGLDDYPVSFVVSANKKEDLERTIIYDLFPDILCFLTNQRRSFGGRR